MCMGGEKGDKGDIGWPGEPGPPGLSGQEGEQGMPGQVGMEGEDGDNRVDGSDGAIGDTGSQGLPGMDGTDGTIGATGATGPPGSRGPRGPGNGIRASAYINWGRQDCPANAILVYNGSVAGRYGILRGGGTDFLCLPRDPTFYNIMRSSSIFPTSQVAGIQYFTTSEPLSIVHSANTLCAMCVTLNRPTLMFPATTNCPAQWDEEYTGFLMSSRDFDASTNANPTETRLRYICVNDTPDESSPNTISTNAALIAHVHANCPAMLLDYSSYNSAQLACVVCSKPAI